MARLAGVPKPTSTPVQVIERILDSMDDGVLVVDPNGAILTCNAAASRVLGLDGAPPAGASFGETFLVVEGLDAFTGAVLDAVQAAPGRARPAGRRVVDVRVGGEPRSIALATTYLRGGPEGARHGAAVVAVFSDITEVAALREAEVRLGRKVEAQLAELSEAYRTVEERNEALAATLRKARVARVIAAGAVVAVVATAGGWLWQSDTSISALLGARPAGPAPSAEEPATWTVAAAPVRQTTSVVGRIEPGHVTRVLSPAGGTVRALHFTYGEAVGAGAPLVEIDVSATVREHRSVRSRYLEARKRVEALEAWEGGREMASARRQVTRAKDAVAKQRRRVEQTAYLLEEGVIPAAEHEGAVEALGRLEEDRAAAERELVAVRGQADADARERADLEYRNLREQLEGLRKVMDAAVVRAPAGGIVMAPAPGSGARTSGTGDRRLLEGVSVADGQALVQIADVETLSVAAVVEEVEVTKLGVGQPVRVTGDAFPGIELAGELVEVASHASSSAPGASAQFPVRARLGTPAPDERRALRIGMSVDLHILVRDDPAVLTVPLAAVERSGDALMVRVRDAQTGEAHAVRVETGATTPTAVEIVSGLREGDQVLLPAR